MKEVFKNKIVLIGTIISVLFICICPIAFIFIATFYSAINNLDTKTTESLGYNIAPAVFGIIFAGFLVLIGTIGLYFLQKNKTKSN